MAQNAKLRVGPVALSTTTTTNILNPPTTTGGTASGPAFPTKTYILLKHVRVTNITGTAATCGLWIGTTGINSAGSSCIFGGTASGAALTQGQNVAANSFIEWYGEIYMSTADFLVGGSGTSAALNLEAEGEIGISY